MPSSAMTDPLSHHAQSTTLLPSCTCSPASSLATQDIEQICKAFIRLLLAKETSSHGNDIQNNTDVSAKTAASA